MGTNYYLAPKPACAACGRPHEGRHIGKSSGGWCFSLAVYPGDPDAPQSLDDWVALWSKPGAEIRDEYGRTVTPAEMLEVVCNRSHKREAVPFGYSSWAEFHRLNHSTAGPNGLIRNRIDGFCVRHGEGTWDEISGDFC